MKRLKEDPSCAACGAKESKEKETALNNQSKENTINPGRIGLQQCAKCQVVFYCSKECQRKHWKQHKPNCKIGLPGWKASKKDIRVGEKIKSDYINNLFKESVSMPKGGQRRRRQLTEEERLEERVARSSNLGRIGSSHGTPRENPEATKLFEQSLSRIEEGHLSEAIELLDKAIDLDGYHHLYFNTRAYCYLLVEQYHFALIDASTAQNLKPDFIPAWSNLVKANFCLGDHKIARKDLKLMREIFVTDTRGKDYTNNEHFHLIEETADRLKKDLDNVQGYPFHSVFTACGPMCYLVTKGLYLRKQQDLLIVDLKVSHAKKIDKFVNHLYYNQIEPGTMFQLGDFVEEDEGSKRVKQCRVALYIPIKNPRYIKVIKKEFDTVKYEEEMHPAKFFAAVILFSSKQDMEEKLGRKCTEGSVKKTDGSFSNNHILVTKAEGEAYLASIMNNWHEWRKRYANGETIGTSLPYKYSKTRRAQALKDESVCMTSPNSSYNNSTTSDTDSSARRGEIESELVIE